MIRDVFKIIPKALNPRYYTDLGDEEPVNAFKYFLVLMALAFLFAAILAAPKIYLMKEGVEKGFLEIKEMKFSGTFKTTGPIMIPRNNPAVTFDTTGNKTRDTEILLVTDKKVYYNLFGREEEQEIHDYDITQNRDEAGEMMKIIMIALIPGVVLFYYLMYLIKYLAIMTLNVAISFGIAKLFKNSIEFKQAVSLAIYTATPMVLIEILSIPFFIKKYLLSYSPFVGMNFSIIAITFYLTLYVTAIRVNGSKAIKG